jgi:endonuclease/exonuclease/phosphatase family metal-dependent hydrolase
MVRRAGVLLMGMLLPAGVQEGVAAPETPTTRPATRPATQPATVTFTVATYNINFGNPNLKGIAGTIRKADADVVCVQESTAAARGYLTRHLQRLYPHMRFRDGRYAEGFAFLSRVPISHLKFLPRTAGYFGTWLCQVKLGGRQVQIANVHLQPTLPPRKADLRELWKRFVSTERTRLREIAALHKKLSKTLPVIVAGDFNAPPMLPTAAFLTERGFTDSFASVTEDAARYHTWHWHWQGVHWRQRLDYIFHSKHMRTQSSRILPSSASDHYLVVSRLCWAPKAGASPTTTPAAASQPATQLSKMP